MYSGGITNVEQLPHYAGTAILTDQDLLPDFKAATKNGDTVWLLWTTGFGGSKPNVPGNWSVVQEQQAADTPGFKGSIIVTEYHVR